MPELPDGTDPGADVRALCKAEGFGLVRFAPAELMVGARDAARDALDEGRLADMAWMTAEWLHRATDPEQFLSGARTLVLVALPYHSEEPSPTVGPGATRGRSARYAWGRDYHRVFEAKLRRIARAIREKYGASARATVDYGPLLERPLAAAAGMGWLGKSTMLLVPGFGPWVLLGAIATTLELTPDRPLSKSCGSCSRCVVACPTGALGTDGSVLDARLCISYQTIENRGSIPRELRTKFGDWVFGCDACLDACPVGATNHDSYPDFKAPDIEQARPALAELLALDEAGFRARFQGRALMRAKRDGLARNACVALGNVGTADDFPALVAALDDFSPLVRGHAAWGVTALANQHGLQTAAHTALERHGGSEQDPGVREELTIALANLEKPNAKIGVHDDHSR